MDTQSASASSLSNNHSMHLLKLVVGDVCLRACGLILPIPSFLHSDFVVVCICFKLVHRWFLFVVSIVALIHGHLGDLCCCRAEVRFVTLLFCCVSVFWLPGVEQRP